MTVTIKRTTTTENTNTKIPVPVLHSMPCTDTMMGAGKRNSLVQIVYHSIAFTPLTNVSVVTFFPGTNGVVVMKITLKGL